jgi:hypothetical protein
MNDTIPDIDVSKWFSTYGLLTARRIFERFNIALDDDELLSIHENPSCVYSLLLRVPLKNIFNGIVLQQAHDYQVYAQKLFVDYLLSGEGDKDAESSGAHTREDLEAERNKLMDIGALFNQEEEAHQHLIYESQGMLMERAEALKASIETVAKKIAHLLSAHQIEKNNTQIIRAIRFGIIHYAQLNNDILSLSTSYWEQVAMMLDMTFSHDLRQEWAAVMKEIGDPKGDLEELLSVYLEKAQDLCAQFKNFRSQFYHVILRATELIQLLPDYHVDKEKEDNNRSSLYFDAHIGEA